MLQAEPDPEPVLGSSTPVQNVQDTQESSTLHEDSDLEEGTPSKGKISRELKALGQTKTSLLRTARKYRQLISYAGMIGTAFLSYTSSRGVAAEQLYQSDNVFVSTFDPAHSSKLSTSATRAYAANQYVSPDDTI